MKLSQIININAILSIALGIACALYAPLVLSALGIPESNSNDVALYWNAAAFTRMYGAALFSYGLLLFAIRKIVPDPNQKPVRRGILFSLILGNIIALFTAVTQQVIVWGSTIGWILSAFYLVFPVLYIYFIIRDSHRSDNT